MIRLIAFLSALLSFPASADEVIDLWQARNWSGYYIPETQTCGMFATYSDRFMAITYTQNGTPNYQGWRIGFYSADWNVESGQFRGIIGIDARWTTPFNAQTGAEGNGITGPLLWDADGIESFAEGITLWLDVGTTPLHFPLYGSKAALIKNWDYCLQPLLGFGKSNPFQ